MSTFNDVLQKWVNTDYKILVSLAKEAIVRLTPACKQVDPKNGGYTMLSAIILSAVCADGTVSTMEQTMLKEILNLDDNKMRQFIKSYDQQYPGLTEYFCQNMGSHLQADTIMLVTTLCAVDEKISSEETKLIKKLMGAES